MNRNTQKTIFPPLPPVQLRKDRSKFRKFERNFWQYYLSLEEELLATKKYVSFDKVNRKTYSLEYLKIYQAVCSEIDVVGKELARAVDSSLSDEGIKSIHSWWYYIQNSYIWDECGNELPRLEERTVMFANAFELCPWKRYSVEYVQSPKRKYIRLKQNPAKWYKTPEWWTAYNEVKHRRMSETERDGERVLNYTQANLENVSNAFAALYTLEYSYLSAVGNDKDMAARDYGHLFEQKPRIIMTDAIEELPLAAVSDTSEPVQLV